MILVTGGTGLVGAHLLLHLAQTNDQIRATYRLDSGREKTRRLFCLYGKQHLFERIEWARADITDIPALETALPGIGQIYHCAALISFDPNDEERIRKTNIEGTANIVNLALAYRIKKLCHISSTAALGDLKSGEKWVTEDTEWNPEKPHNDYSIAKYGAEMEVWRATQEGLPAIIINPGIVLGPGFWDCGSGKIFSGVARGMKYYTNGTSGFVDARDVARLAQLAMDSDASGERYIAVSQNLMFGEILAMIAKRIGKEPPTIYASPWMTEIAWRLDWLANVLFGRKRRLSKHDARALHGDSQFDNAKTKEKFDFDFIPIIDSVENAVLLETS